MDWDNIKLLLAVEREGSIRGAARSLGLDPSTVSRRLQQLEASVKSPLIDRSLAESNGGALRLNEAGRKLSAIAEKMESQLSLATRNIQASDSEPAGRVRVSFPQILGRPIQRLLSQIPAKFPQIALELVCSDQVVNLAAGDAEIVVRMEEEPPPQLVGMRLGALVLGLYSSTTYATSHAAPITDISHQWVDWGPQFRRKAAVKWLNDTYPDRRIAVEGASGQAVLDAIEVDMGIGIVARLHAEHLTEWALLPQGTCPSIWLLTTREARARSNVQVVFEELKSFSDVFDGHIHRAAAGDSVMP